MFAWADWVKTSITMQLSFAQSYDAKGAETRYGILCFIHFLLSWFVTDIMICTQNYQQEIMKKSVFIL
jgi:hypothetical protein